MTENPTEQTKSNQDMQELAIKFADQTLPIILDAARAEYDAEQQRSSVFEARTGMLLTLLAALLVYNASTFAIPGNNISVKIASLVVTMEFISMGALVGAIFFSVAVLRPRDYCRINVENMISESMPGPLMERLIDGYIKAISLTAKRTDRRKDYFNIAIYISIAGVIALVIERILQMYLL